MKMIDLEYVLENKLNLSQFIHLIEEIHKQVTWSVQSEDEMLLGYTKEDAWLYEYMVDYKDFKNIRFVVSKIDALPSTTYCNLEFLDHLDDLEYCNVDDLGFYELIYLKDVIKDCCSELEKQTKENLGLMIPILHFAPEEELYAYEINDMLVDVVNSRVDALKKMNKPSYELQLLEEILKHNSYKGERMQMINHLNEYFTHDQGYLAFSGIKVSKGKNYYFSFFDDPRYDYVVSPNRDYTVLYHDLLNKFF